MNRFAVLWLAALALASLQTVAIVRERQSVSVGSATEEWRLEWRGTPQPVCGPDDPNWFTCPCHGFAFGETGTLDLVRLRAGQQEDRMPLSPLFRDEDGPGAENAAALARWPVAPGDTLEDMAAVAPQIHARPEVRTMQLTDYDHDGRATEFLLLVGSSPCGHNAAVVVGLSRGRPMLHAFTSVAHSERPLVLETRIWRSLLQAGATATTLEVACGDHGGEEESDVRLRVTPAGLEATRLIYTCTSDGRRGTLESSQSF